MTLPTLLGDTRTEVNPFSFIRYSSTVDLPAHLVPTIAINMLEFKVVDRLINS